MEKAENPNNTFEVSDAAFARIEKLLSDEPPGTRFCVSVLGGGCSGFQYHFDLAAKEPEADDIVIDHGNAKVLVDSAALPFIGGSMLDYATNLASAGFEIRNPNASARCGCGNSFSIKL